MTVTVTVRGTIQLRGVKKTFPSYTADSWKVALVGIARRDRARERRTILDGVDLTVAAAERVGIIGKNGAGKSTLFRLMSGILTPDAGVVDIGGRVSPLIEITAGLVPDMTGRENIHLNAAILGLTRAELRERFDDIVAFAGIGEFLDTPVRFYSSGMMARIGFAVATHVDADVVLVDEVLAVGDEQFQRRCLARMDALSAQGTTIVLVSHDLDAVARHMQRVVWLEQGRVRMHGTPAEVLPPYRDSVAQSNVSATS